MKLYAIELLNRTFQWGYFLTYMANLTFPKFPLCRLLCIFNVTRDGLRTHQAKWSPSIGELRVCGMRTPATHGLVYVGRTWSLVSRRATSYLIVHELYVHCMRASKPPTHAFQLPITPLLPLLFLPQHIAIMAPNKIIIDTDPVSFSFMDLKKCGVKCSGGGETKKEGY
jgi:hypothetical protein